MKTTLDRDGQRYQLVEWSLTATARLLEDRRAIPSLVFRSLRATGSVALSEAIAQETFLTAWRELTKLSDAARLRGWLCGICPELVNNSLRRGQREPVSYLEPLDALHEPVSPEPSPWLRLSSREEEAIVWNAVWKKFPRPSRTADSVLPRRPVVGTGRGGNGIE